MRRREVWLLAGVTTLAAILRFSTLSVQSYWHDEAVTAARILRPGLGATLHAVARSESAPPLYYVLAWGWSKLFGTGEAGLRSLSAVFGTLTVPVAYALGARLASKRVGWIAAALVAVSPWMVWYSQEARAYALLVFLSSVSLLAFARALERPTSRRLGLWALVSALALATHYFAVFVVVPEAIWLMTAKKARWPVPAFAFGSVVTGIALLPLELHQAGTKHTHWIAKLGLRHRVLGVPKEFITGVHGAPVHGLAIVTALLIAAGAWLAFARTDRREQRALLIAGGLGLVVLAAPLALSLVGVDFFIARNVSPAWVPFAVALALGFGAVRAGKAGLVAAAALCAALLSITIAVNFDAKMQRADWRGVARALPHLVAARAIVTPDVDPLAYYLPKASVVHAGRVLVQEVDLVGWPSRGPRFHVRAPARGFKEVQRRTVETLTLLRFRSVEPLPVVPRRLARHHLGPLRGSVLLERSTGPLPQR